MKTFTIGACLFSVLWLSACARPFVPQTPKGFVELENSSANGYDYRAAHPDGLVTAVRVIRNEPEGDLTFWSRAIENQLRQVKGYRLIEQTTVKNREGVTGNLLQFGHDEGKSPHLYRVVLFLHDDDLFILEQGGTCELVKAHEADLMQAIQGFSIKTGASRTFSYSGD